jgi:anti-sigma B factor antagonist
MSVSISSRVVSGIYIVRVSGRLTMGEGSATVRDTLREIAKIGHRKILLDLSELTFLDSSGIGVLVSSFATIAGLGGRLKLMNLTNRVKDLLLITKLYTVFEIYDDEATGIASFAETAASAQARF